jgi:hypothetical protein
MDLGYSLYFGALGLGGIALAGIAAYFVWEITTHRHRVHWTKRGRGAKVVIALLSSIFAYLLFIPLRMIWVTRIGAIPGSYTCNGVWGSATLKMESDGSFVEVWQFRNEYNDKPEGQGMIRGIWRNVGRDWLTRDIDLTPFKGLAKPSRDRVSGPFRATVRGYGGVTSVEVDVGADIVFWK